MGVVPRAIGRFLLNMRIGFFLALRQLYRSSAWTTTLIVFVMVLTFLNLVVVSGILVGLLQGAVDGTREKYLSDVIISTQTDKSYIENSANVMTIVGRLPEVENFTPRYRTGAVLEANYKTRRDDEKADTASAQLVGIDPYAEDAVTHLRDDLIEGEFVEPGDFDQIVLGHFLLKQYLPIESPAFTALDDVGIGSKIRIKVGAVVREVTVKGIIKNKVDDVSLSAFMVDSQMRNLIGRSDGNVTEIAIDVKDGVDSAIVRDEILRYGVGSYAKVQTFDEALPKFLKDMIATFSLLGTVFSSLGLVVASITIFIVVFINAIIRRKFIGILKGIGINGQAIELSYVMQSIFYALIGSAVGLVIVYGILVPYLAAYPIDFPFSDGILVAPLNETMARIGLLIGATVIAGYVPARMIVRKNTLNSILGRD
jgi:ABC-type lipoprotein release transport system permease subunit